MYESLIPKVLVTHPCKQYTHHLVYALQEAGYLNKFITSFWYKPGAFPFKLIEHFPDRFKQKIVCELSKKSYSRISDSSVEQFPVVEVVRESIERITRSGFTDNFMYFRNRVHDYYACLRLDKYNPDIVIGYETSSRKTFKAAKMKGRICILDLAQVHYNYLEQLNGIYPELKLLHNDKKLMDRVNRYKQDEIELADYFFVLSDYARKSLTDNGIEEDRIFKINLGFDKKIFTRKINYSSNGRFRLLFVGSITRRKGIHILLEAYKKLNIKDIELTLVGNVADGNDLLNEYKGYFRHINFLDQKSLTNYYQEADVFVFPSLLDSWAMVVVESMACGTPVIVSENTGSSELVTNNDNGFVIKTGEVGALQDKIMFFYNNRHLLESFGKNAYESVQNHGWEDYYKKVKDTINIISIKHFDN